MPTATTVCENCGTPIGKLETPCRYENHVVCMACHHRITDTRATPRRVANDEDVWVFVPFEAWGAMQIFNPRIFYLVVLTILWLALAHGILRDGLNPRWPHILIPVLLLVVLIPGPRRASAFVLSVTFKLGIRTIRYTLGCCERWIMASGLMLTSIAGWMLHTARRPYWRTDAGIITAVAIAGMVTLLFGIGLVYALR